MSHRALGERQFGEYVLRHHTPEMGRGHHMITAHRTDPETGDVHEVGYMNWNAKHVLNVQVTASHRRQGVAKAMWEMGQETSPRAKHSADRTAAGDAWAKSVGGSLPRRKPSFPATQTPW